MSVLFFGTSETQRPVRLLSLVSGAPRRRIPVRMHHELIKVMVASRDVFLARKALLVCPDTAIVRSVPRPKDDRVELEIRFPIGQGDVVINRILACLPDGEIGGISLCAGYRPSVELGHITVVPLHGA